MKFEASPGTAGSVPPPAECLWTDSRFNSQAIGSLCSIKAQLGSIMSVSPLFNRSRPLSPYSEQAINQRRTGP